MMALRLDQAVVTGNSWFLRVRIMPRGKNVTSSGECFSFSSFYKYLFSERQNRMIQGIIPEKENTFLPSFLPQGFLKSQYVSTLSFLLPFARSIA